MDKVFRPWNVDQTWLLPPSVHELVPANHPAHFVRELVRSELDLSAIYAAYDERRGYPPYHPAMMTALLLYGYTQGLFSSRKLARACHERVDVMAVTALERPDFRTIAAFRLRHLDALQGLFVAVLRLCQRAGLVRLGHVALDGTKVKANAAKSKAMSYRRMGETEARLQAEVKAWFDRARTADDSEDAALGETRGDELPDWVANRTRRLARIAEAKAAIEAEARAEAEARRKERDDDDAPPPAHPKHRVDGTPNDDAQRNFTDPESRIRKTRDGFVQGYNAQLAVDHEHQIIVAAEVVAAQNDGPSLVPMLDQIRANTSAQAAEISADYGYLSEDNLRACRRRHIAAYIATGRQRHGDPGPASRRAYSQPLTRAMALKLRRGGYRSRYRLRKQVVEPVIGQIKAALGFRAFLLRGLRKTRAEWRLVATAHNLLKLARAAN
jgi:transposase